MSKKAALFAGILFIFGPVMWIVPPWVTASMEWILWRYFVGRDSSLSVWECKGYLAGPHNRLITLFSLCELLALFLSNLGR
ncbi:hypothetical protein ACFFUO_10570 [Vibrio artabrorum]|uniref:Uncharacterized protein n=1 Tax=Vibrio artabrorum TaxID=446374 RepID=A0ABT8CN46_9VIBR|nr:MULTISPECIES: hypothetical protein [Vibrio]MDN3702327.1 hypothetical protein [Vibrio artabrorum]